MRTIVIDQVSWQKLMDALRSDEIAINALDDSHPDKQEWKKKNFDAQVAAGAATWGKDETKEAVPF